MIETSNLPDVGTPEEAREKMRDSYKAFLDAAAKFVAISDFYGDKSHEGQPLGENFINAYTAAFQKLKASSSEDVRILLAYYTLLDLDFLGDVKDNLDAYHNYDENGDDPSLSDYDQACDYLAVKDTFTDIINEFKDVNEQIVTDRELMTNYNDPEYDLNAKVTEENKEN